jgi:hypothetical protein
LTVIRLVLVSHVVVKITCLDILALDTWGIEVRGVAKPCFVEPLVVRVEVWVKVCGFEVGIVRLFGLGRVLEIGSLVLICADVLYDGLVVGLLSSLGVLLGDVLDFGLIVGLLLDGLGLRGV